MDEKAIRDRIRMHEREAVLWREILNKRSCKSCEHWLIVGGCALAEGSEPPAEVQKTGCPAWEYDEVPF